MGFLPIRVVILHPRHSRVHLAQHTCEKEVMSAVMASHGVQPAALAISRITGDSVCAFSATSASMCSDSGSVSLALILRREKCEYLAWFATARCRAKLVALLASKRIRRDAVCIRTHLFAQNEERGLVKKNERVLVLSRLCRLRRLQKFPGGYVFSILFMITTFEPCICVTPEPPGSTPSTRETSISLSERSTKKKSLNLKKTSRPHWKFSLCTFAS